VLGAGKKTDENLLNASAGWITSVNGGSATNRAQKEKYERNYKQDFCERCERFLSDRKDVIRDRRSFISGFRFFSVWIS
jgi:hypothetical protein